MVVIFFVGCIYGFLSWVLSDVRGDVVQKVCMDKLILHRMELCILEAESLKSYSAAADA